MLRLCSELGVVLSYRAKVDLNYNAAQLYICNLKGKLNAIFHSPYWLYIAILHTQTKWTLHPPPPNRIELMISCYIGYTMYISISSIHPSTHLL